MIPVYPDYKIAKTYSLDNRIITRVVFLRNQKPYELILRFDLNDPITYMEMKLLKQSVHTKIAFYQITDKDKPCEDPNTEVTEVDEEIMREVINDEIINSSRKEPIKSLYEPDNRKTMNTETVGTGKQLVSFGKAVEALKQGKRVQRKSWNGKGLFVFMQIPASVPIDIVPKMSSLPQSVKDEFARRLDKADKNSKSDMDIRYNNQLALVHPSNLTQGWAPSSSDALAEDWIILD